VHPSIIPGQAGKIEGKIAGNTSIPNREHPGEATMKIRATVIVSGLVQGVNFRHYTRVQAEALGVAGWVRNRPDGHVEGCFEGEEPAVEALIDWCRRGPDWARVDGVEVQREAYRGEFDGFTVRR
jgi:acylphosphatase